MEKKNMKKLTIEYDYEDMEEIIDDTQKSSKENNLEKDLSRDRSSNLVATSVTEMSKSRHCYSLVCNFTTIIAIHEQIFFKHISKSVSILLLINLLFSAFIYLLAI
ncbi:hypothetical protein RhiirA4_473634 [Rhizophagus irregularis]|uniref:Uncharacterized protein n=1 Tax=Rhizophagus irregularis TaxID=588596 RepID=A0A2I1H731_9GLOM|nr:hypothetical protein RhiirA4_473634 [Rhizophagus irregularis]